MRFIQVLLAFTGLCLITALFSQAIRDSGPPDIMPAGSVIYRQDPVLTPGATDPAVTQANIDKTICVSGYTATVRNVPESVKKERVRTYLAHHPDGPKCKPVGEVSCEIDHLISLELGGKNDAANLWPQPYCPKDGTGGKTCFGASEKDKVENYLKRQICSHKMTLDQAQKAIVTDWYEVYRSIP